MSAFSSDDLYSKLLDVRIAINVILQMKAD